MSKPVRAPTFRRSLMQASIALLGATALGIAACGGGGGGDGTIGNEQPLENSQTASTTGRVTVLGAALDAPWGLTFLPDGRMLVSEKGGTMALVSADGASVQARLTTSSGLPGVDTTGQGGLLDVVYDGGWIYFTFAEAGNGGSGTALARAQLNGTALQNFAVIWRQTPKVGGGVHYGSRIAFGADGLLYVAAGERGVEANNGTARSDASGVQVASNGIGKVMRMNRDGSNASVFSTGHRNPQGAAFAPGGNDLWITEHGPQGGDELNRVIAGGNYGWPVKSYGCNYGDPVGNACRIGGGTHTGYVEPKAIWVPTSSAPSGLLFYNGAQFPDWNGNLFAGALAGTTLWRIVLDGNGNAASRQEIAAVKALGARIRDVRQGPDGNIYLLTNGDGSANANRIVRLAP